MSESPQTAPGKSSVVPSRRWLLVFLTVGSLGLAIWAVAEIVGIERALSRGRVLLRKQRPAEAERELNRYLWLHPRSPEAILLLAEAVISGSARSPQEAAELAISQMQTIPDESPFGAEARMREGRLALLILHQPDRAEKLLMRSAELDPELPDSHYLLWKLFDMTERFYYSEPHFWNTYNLTPDALKAEQLRNWYLSQFSPGTSNAELDRRMGFLTPGELPGDHIDLVRLDTFLSNEADSPMVVAANARFLLHLHERDEAIKVLTGISATEEAISNPFYLSAMVTVLMELGRLDEARSYFGRWPQPGTGFVYWSVAGRVFEVADRNDSSAVKAFDDALSIWPGPVEWSIMHRKAQCLARLGDRSAADAMLKEAKRIELLMEPEVHQKLRLAMADLSSRESLLEMVEFYQLINRQREAECWQRVIDRLPSLPIRVYSGR